MGGKTAGESLEARMEDYVAAAERGQVAVSPFLSPGERKQAERSLAARGLARQAVLWGGYREAERVCLLLLPSFYVDWIAEGEPDLSLLPLDPCDGVGALLIRGSGYRTLAHRDYLGSILGLGLERDAIGDIAVQTPTSAVVFCKRQLLPFLLETLDKVASDTVVCSEYEMGEDFTDGRQFSPIQTTVASPRLDCLVAAFTDCSREEAQRLVRTGLVEVDYETEERVDHLIEAPAVLSIRGFGRFYLRSYEGENRKGRLRVRAEKPI